MEVRGGGWVLERAADPSFGCSDRGRGKGLNLLFQSADRSHRIRALSAGPRVLVRGEDRSRNAEPMVTIRLTRTGAKKRPFYHLNVAESSARRDGRFIERVGYFNPIATGQAQRLSVDLERVDYWISVGAKPSDRVAALIKQARKGDTGPKVIEKKVEAPKPVEAPAAEEAAEEVEAAAEEAGAEDAAAEEAGDAEGEGETES